MSPCFDYTGNDSEYQVDYRQQEEPAKSGSGPRHRSTASTRNRRPAGPKSFNGIHRRRSKRITW